MRKFNLHLYSLTVWLLCCIAICASAQDFSSGAMEYENVSITNNLFTGNADITLSIFAKEIKDFPVTLTSNPQVFGKYFGVHWELNLGGYINRFIYGEPDDSPNGYYNNSNDQIDLYSYSINGQKGQFVMRKNANGSIECIPFDFDNTRIVNYRGVIEIWDSEGTVYRFQILIQNLWHLKSTTYNNGKTITYNYDRNLAVISNGLTKLSQIHFEKGIIDIEYRLLGAFVSEKRISTLTYTDKFGNVVKYRFVNEYPYKEKIYRKYNNLEEKEIYRYDNGFLKTPSKQILLYFESHDFSCCIYPFSLIEEKTNGQRLSAIKEIDTFSGDTITLNEFKYRYPCSETDGETKVGTRSSGSFIAFDKFGAIPILDKSLWLGFNKKHTPIVESKQVGYRYVEEIIPGKGKNIYFYSFAPDKTHYFESFEQTSINNWLRGRLLYKACVNETGNLSYFQVNDYHIDNPLYTNEDHDLWNQNSFQKVFRRLVPKERQGDYIWEPKIIDRDDSEGDSAPLITNKALPKVRTIQRWFDSGNNISDVATWIASPPPLIHSKNMQYPTKLFEWAFTQTAYYKEADTRYYYDSDWHVYPTRIVTKNSKGQKITTKRKFVQDYQLQANNPITVMKNKHLVAPIIEEQHWLQDGNRQAVLLHGSLAEYNVINENQASYCYLSTIYETENNEPITPSPQGFNDTPSSMPAYSSLFPGNKTFYKPKRTNFCKLMNGVLRNTGWQDENSFPVSVIYNKLGQPIASIQNAKPGEVVVFNFEEVKSCEVDIHGSLKYYTGATGKFARIMSVFRPQLSVSIPVFKNGVKEISTNKVYTISATTLGNLIETSQLSIQYSFLYADGSSSGWASVASQNCYPNIKELPPFYIPVPPIIYPDDDQTPDITTINETRGEHSSAVYEGMIDLSSAVKEIQEINIRFNFKRFTSFNNEFILLDDIRFFPKDALVTTFIYDEDRLSSETDHQYRTTYYVYDKLKRLQLIKDHNGNVVQAYTYNILDL